MPADTINMSLLSGRIVPGSAAYPLPVSDDRHDVNANGNSHVELSVWGLSVRELHDAYWRSKGIQCVRRGESLSLDPAADMLLLIQPDQLVLFEMHSLLDRLIWHRASITRVQILQQEAPTYCERMVLDQRGFVQRIERRYQQSQEPCHRVLVTDRKCVAERWMQAPTGRAWRNNLRDMHPRPSVDRQQTVGHCFSKACAQQQRRFLAELVDRWDSPDRVIDGIHCFGQNIWKRRGDAAPNATLVGPVWLGNNSFAAHVAPCIVGPAWIADAVGPAHEHASHQSKVAVRPFGQVEGRATKPATARRQRRSVYQIMKRVFDVLVSSLVLLAAWPLLLLIAIAIIVDDGFPVLFRHSRQTRGGRRFNCLKFRTMLKNAETLVSDLRQRNLCDGPQVHIEDDPRVTRVGQYLRKFHLDELPQFWNVLMGDMSIVGPRPSPDRENRICPAWRELRLSVRPGITGLWQLKRTRRRGQDFQEWIRFDMEYVRSAGLWLDMSICLRTVHMILSGRNRR